MHAQVSEAYWAGRDNGYTEGHTDGWESGVAAGAAVAADRPRTPEPLRLDQILPPRPTELDQHHHDTSQPPQPKDE